MQVETSYITPAGKSDFPYALVFDGTGLTNGLNYQNLLVPVQGDLDSFILRSIVGIPSCLAAQSAGGKFNYQNASRSYTAGNPSTGIYVPNVWPVLPEKEYPINSAIPFDLYNVLRASHACTSPILDSYIAFMGVKRFNGPGYGPQTSSYKYRELPQCYEFDLTINWANGNPPRSFVQPMTNWDFQLLSIRICNSTGSGALLTNDFMIQMYDKDRHQLSSKPLPQSYLNAARRTASLSSPYQAVFPTPPVIYPQHTAITFDITSMVCAADLPRTYNIVFQGIWRIPC